MSIAWTLLTVGMGTVFFALLIIIYFSKGMIWVINRYFPEETVSAEIKSNDALIPSKIVAVITAAVNIASGGKAKVSKIEKIKHI